jgi:hypothetical protein
LRWQQQQQQQQNFGNQASKVSHKNQWVEKFEEFLDIGLLRGEGGGAGEGGFFFSHALS